MIQNFEEFVNENIWQGEFATMLNESKNYTIPTFGTLDDIKKFLIDNGIVKQEYERYMTYFYKQYKGNHVYMSLGCTNYATEDGRKTYHAEIYISADNKKPSILNKVRNEWGKLGKDYLVFNITDGELIIDKSTVDTWFGKLMPHTSGNSDTVVNCFNAYLQELAMDGGNEWKLLYNKTDF